MSPAARHETRPAGDFYWAVLDTTVLGGARRSPVQLGFLFEGELPVPIDEVHAAYRPLSRDRCLACGIDRARLEHVNGGAVALYPASIPEELDADVEPATLNLLTGPYAPPRVTRLACRWKVGLAVLAIACTGFAAAGMLRRAADAGAEATRIREATAAILGGDTDMVRAQLGLRASLAELRQTRHGAVPSDDGDVAATLAELCALWPDGVAARIDTCTVTSSVIVVAGSVPATADAQRLADALAPLAGWQLQQPNVESGNDAVRLTLRLTREKGS